MEVGRRIHNGRALLVDDVQVIQRTTMPPTPSPTFSTTNEVNTGPSGAPSRMTDTPSTDNVVACPPIGDSPIVVGAGSVILSLAEGSSLCSLTKEIISSDGNQKTLIPVALSYDSHPWEQAAGEFAQTIFGGSEILCYSSGCQLNLPPLEQEGSESYLLSSSSYSLSKTNEYSRFLETATFGVTEDDLENIDTISSSSNSQDNIAHWVAQQMDTNITPMSSHREFWRKGLNGRVSAFVFFSFKQDPLMFLTNMHLFAYRFLGHWESPQQTTLVINIQDGERSVLFVMTTHGTQEMKRF